MKVPYENMNVPFGKYRKTELKNVPDDYLKWLFLNGFLKGKILLHYQVRFNLPKNKYSVTVTDSIRQDGVYIVDAYSAKNAISQCQVIHKIQNTQSFHGTGYSVQRI